MTQGRCARAPSPFSYPPKGSFIPSTINQTPLPSPRRVAQTRDYYRMCRCAVCNSRSEPCASSSLVLLKQRESHSAPTCVSHDAVDGFIGVPEVVAAGRPYIGLPWARCVCCGSLPSHALSKTFPMSRIATLRQMIFSLLGLASTADIQ
jgi:hypothetical protein